MNPGFVTYKCCLNDNFYVNLVNLPYSDPLDIGHKNMEKIGKNEEISIFQATFASLGVLEKC